ncbi:MAG: bile acid:sodium symporter [Candidatus Binatia bacterium]
MSPGPVQLAAPFLLFAMMFVVGLELTVRDFRRIAAAPRAVVVGTLGQLILLPAVTAAGLVVLDLSPRVTAGVVLILAAPGGGISNVFTLLAGANVALSVTLTAVASLLAVVTLPVITAVGFDVLAGGAGPDGDLVVPVLPMIGQLVVLVLVPIGLGMRVRARRAAWADAKGPLLRRLVLAGVVVVIAISATSDSTGLLGDTLDALWVGLAWTAMAMILGYTVAVVAGLEAVDRFTMAIEFSVKNVGLAAIVAISALGRPELAVFAGAYVLTGYPLAVLASLAFRRVYHHSAG